MSTTSTVLLNLHEWLVQHTWIIWYVGEDGGHHLVYQAVIPNDTPTGGRWTGCSPHGLFAGGPTDPFGRLIPSRRHALPTEPTQLPSGMLSSKFPEKPCPVIHSKSNLQPGLNRFSIRDRRNDWCGTIILDDSYFNSVGATFEFIAISEARDFSMAEYDSWTYYIPGERGESEWYSYYTLMIERVNDPNVCERLGLAKIYKTACQPGSFEPGFLGRKITSG